MMRNILNFHIGNIEKLPNWFKSPYRVIFGVGDNDSKIDSWKEYNVYIVLPEVKNVESCQFLRENLLKLKNTNRIMCFIDIFNKNQTQQFIKLFYKKCDIIDFNGPHCVSFSFSTYALLLTKKGKVIGLNQSIPLSLFFTEKSLLQYIEKTIENDNWNVSIRLRFISAGKHIKNIKDVNNMKKYILRLILQYNNDIRITSDIWKEIQKEWNNYVTVINNLLNIFSEIMIYKGINTHSHIKPLVAIMTQYKHLGDDNYHISLILQYPMSKSKIIKDDKQTSEILKTLLNS
jgi:hypothetical protein